MQKYNILFACLIGSMFECFDFFVFVALAPLLSKIFFPHSTTHLALIFTYLIFSGSYFLRIIGGILFGHLGDKFGRKKIFIVTILCMSIPSLLIGMLPSYAQIGYLSTILLAILRSIQGIGMGGEMSGGITYIYEQYKSNQYFFCGLLAFSFNFAIALSALSIKFMFIFFTYNDMLEYAWRIPFLFGCILTFIGVYLRKKAQESDEFRIINNMHRTEKIPLFTLFHAEKQRILIGFTAILFASIGAGIFYMFPQLIFPKLHIQLIEQSKYSFIITLLYATCILITSYIASFIGSKKLIYTSLISTVLIVFIYLFFNIQINSLNKLYILAACLVISNALLFGIANKLLGDLFPTSIRFSAIGMIFNLSYTIGLGFAPLWISWFLKITHYNNLSILYLLIGFCLIALFIFKNLKHKVANNPIDYV